MDNASASLINQKHYCISSSADFCSKHFIRILTWFWCASGIPYTVTIGTEMLEVYTLLLMLLLFLSLSLFYFN